MASDQIAINRHDIKIAAELAAQYNQSFPAWVAYGYMSVTSLLCILKPRLGFVLVVGNALLRFQDRVPALSSFPIFQMFMAALFLGMLMNKKQIVKTDLSIDKAMLSFLGIAIIGLLYQEPSGLKAHLTVLISSMLYYFFATRLIGTEKELRQLLLLMTTCAALLGSEALINTWNHPPLSPFYLGGGTGQSKRLQGLGYYNNANEFGMLMIMMVPYLFSIILGKMGLLKKIISGAVMCILVLTMAKAESRTVMVCVALMIGLMLIFKSGGNIMKKMMVGGIFGVVLVIGLSFVPGPIQHRLDSIMNYQSDPSFQGRLRSWAMGWHMVT